MLFNSTNYGIRNNFYTGPQRDITWNALDPGLYYYNVTVFDDLNNSNSTETRNITLDNMAPVVDFCPACLDNNSNVSQSWVFINLTVTEENEANTTFYLYNASGFVDSQTYTDETHEHNFTGLADGLYYYNATVVDKASQSSFTETRWVILDTTFPLISFGLNVEDDDKTVSRVWIYANVSVTEDNEKNITFGLYNSSWSNVTTFTTSVREINWSGLADGSYTYNVSIFDMAGNFNVTVKLIKTQL